MREFGRHRTPTASRPSGETLDKTFVPSLALVSQERLPALGVIWIAPWAETSSGRSPLFMKHGEDRSRNVGISRQKGGRLQGTG